MTGNTARNVDRRTWLAGCARAAGLGGIAVAAGVLLSRGQIGSCPYARVACASCRQLPRCGLPSAADVRDQQVKQETR